MCFIPSDSTEILVQYLALDNYLIFMSLKNVRQYGETGVNEHFFKCLSFLDLNIFYFIHGLKSVHTPTVHGRFGQMSREKDVRISLRLRKTLFKFQLDERIAIQSVHCLKIIHHSVSLIKN